MKTCKFCGERIPEEATRCPTCGGDLRTLTTSEKIKASTPTTRIVAALLGLLAILILVYLVSYSTSTPTAKVSQPSPETKTQSEALPAHTVVKNAVILTGRRIEIHVNESSITKDQCLALLSEYHVQALPDGQVSVRKPDKTGEMMPWCVDNFSKGILFNDDLFR